MGEVVDEQQFRGGGRGRFDLSAADGLESLSGTSTYVNSTSYDAAGRVLSRTMGSTVASEYTYYGWSENGLGGRLHTIQSATTYYPYLPYQELEYNYDLNGNITWIRDALAGYPYQQQSFSYDDLNRLETAAASGGYNGNGN